MNPNSPIPRRHLLALGLATSLGMPATALAQDKFPSRPVRIIVPFAAGGAADTAVRKLEPVLSPLLGVPVVVVNAPGADGIIAANELMKSPADGHTLMFGTATSILYVPLTHVTNPPYDSMRDFAPVSNFSSFTFFVFAHDSLGVKSMSELVTYLKANPGKVSFGYGDSTSLIAMAQLQAQTQVDITAVPYKGTGPLVPDFLSGRIQLTVGSLDVLAKTKGKALPLAVLLPKRSAVEPNVPTFAEAGLPQINVLPWSGFFAVANTPQPMIDRLSSAITTALTDANLKQFFAANGGVIEGSTPAAFRQLLTEQFPVWRDAIKFAKVPVK